VGFTFALKKIIREIAKDEGLSGDKSVAEELSAFDMRIDELSLTAFDIYMGCREKLYEIKANEMRDRTFSAFERAGLVKEL
jgi:hypothetical protein